MGVSSFFRRVKNFLWGLLFMAVGIGGAVGWIESDPTMGEPPLSYIVWAVGIAVSIYGLIHVIKSFKRHGDRDYDKEYRESKEYKEAMEKQNDLSPKQINRVYRMRNNSGNGPKYLDVPSMYYYGRPTRDEIIAALEKMGYDRSRATSLANGGSTSMWEVME